MVTESGTREKLCRAICAQLRAGGVGKVRGEPYRRMLGVGPRYAVAAVRRNDEIIARPQDARLCFILEQKAGRAGNEQHPLGPFLVVPEAG